MVAVAVADIYANCGFDTTLGADMISEMVSSSNYTSINAYDAAVDFIYAKLQDEFSVNGTRS